MTISELYKYAVEHQLENMPIELIGIAECGYSIVSDTTFFIRKTTDPHISDRLQLIVTEYNFDTYDLPTEYKDAVSSDDI